MSSISLAILITQLIGCSMSGGATTPDAGSSDATFDAAQPPFSYLIPPHPPPASVPSPPAMSCVGDFIDAGGYLAPACPLPRTVCADQFWQAYYDEGMCVAGQCVWVTNFYYCGPHGCDVPSGRCNPRRNFTAPDGHH